MRLALLARDALGLGPLRLVLGLGVGVVVATVVGMTCLRPCLAALLSLRLRLLLRTALRLRHALRRGIGLVVGRLRVRVDLAERDDVPGPPAHADRREDRAARHRDATPRWCAEREAPEDQATG